VDNYLGKDMPKLGFGLMRLPVRGDELSQDVDLDKLAQLVDRFLSKGFVYFDTAYPYHGGSSEKAVGEVICGNYPRESFTIATKMPTMMINETAQYAKLFDEQLARTKAGFFDFYLQHGLSKAASEKSERLGGWDFVYKMKAQGLAKHVGFSYHDNTANLDEILTRHPETEFVQLQLNYHDWLSDNVQSKLCYEVCMKHKVPVVVMEPVKGGSLATLTPEAQAIFKALDPNATMASWALRFCASLDGILTILSGMNTMEQIEENTSTLSVVKKLSAEEYKAIDKVVEVLDSIEQIPCTSCRYCTDTCPQSINIPSVISLLNQYMQYASTDGIKRRYLQATQRGGKASDCIECAVCESRCPQHLEIVSILKDVVKVFED